jgi:hypothetical protein
VRPSDDSCAASAVTLSSSGRSGATQRGQDHERINPNVPPFIVRAPSGLQRVSAALASSPLRAVLRKKSVRCAIELRKRSVTRNPERLCRTHRFSAPLHVASGRCLWSSLTWSDSLLSRVHSHSALAAENLFLRKQLALFQERKVKPRRADDATRWMMAALSRMFPWGNSLVNVKPDTLIRWQRKGFRLFWRWKSKPTGRPRLPKDLWKLIREMAVDNPIWGEERIANELTVRGRFRAPPKRCARYAAACWR